MFNVRSFNPSLVPHFTAVPRSTHLYGLRNIVTPDMCQAVLDQLRLKDLYKEGNVDIVDVFSGYGLLSSMINYELKPRNHIIIDDTKDNSQIWENRIKFLEKQTQNAENFRYHKMDGHSWSTYKTLVDDLKVILPKTKPRSNVHDELLVVGNLTSPKHGESYFAQWITCCAHQNWLQKYGLVRIVAIVLQSTALKFLAGPNFSKRNRSALKRDMFTKLRLIAISDALYDAKEPVGDAYDPVRLIEDQPIVIPQGALSPAKTDLAVVEIVPRAFDADKVADVEFLAQILMYKSSSHTVADALKYLAPGASEDLAPLIRSDILEKTGRQLTRQDMEALTDVYCAWPFKPLYEDTLSFFTDDTRNF